MEKYFKTNNYKHNLYNFLTLTCLYIFICCNHDPFIKIYRSFSNLNMTNWVAKN